MELSCKYTHLLAIPSNGLHLLHTVAEKHSAGKEKHKQAQADTNGLLNGLSCCDIEVLQAGEES